jgi:hypothetical protein
MHRPWASVPPIAGAGVVGGLERGGLLVLAGGLQRLVPCVRPDGDLARAVCSARAPGAVGAGAASGRREAMLMTSPPRLSWIADHLNARRAARAGGAARVPIQPETGDVEPLAGADRPGVVQRHRPDDRHPERLPAADHLLGVDVAGVQDVLRGQQALRRQGGVDASNLDRCYALRRKRRRSRVAAFAGAQRAAAAAMAASGTPRRTLPSARRNGSPSTPAGSPPLAGT